MNDSNVFWVHDILWMSVNIRCNHEKYEFHDCLRTVWSSSLTASTGTTIRNQFCNRRPRGDLNTRNTNVYVTYE